MCVCECRSVCILQASEWLWVTLTGWLLSRFAFTRLPTFREKRQTRRLLLRAAKKLSKCLCTTRQYSQLDTPSRRGTQGHAPSRPSLAMPRPDHYPPLCHHSLSSRHPHKRRAERSTHLSLSCLPLRAAKIPTAHQHWQVVISRAEVQHQEVWTDG